MTLWPWSLLLLVPFFYVLIGRFLSGRGTAYIPDRTTFARSRGEVSARNEVIEDLITSADAAKEERENIQLQIDYEGMTAEEISKAWNDDKRK